MTTLSVVIPAYNEEDGLAAIVRRVLSMQADLARVGVDGMELLVVDDGSGDRTREIAGIFANTLDNFHLIPHPHNKGYGAALKTGFGLARGELIAFLDADGTYPPEYLPQLCQKALNGADLVIGSRMAGAASQMPFTRRLGNLFFANLLTLVGRQRVTDSASGMRVFRREVLERVSPLPDGLNLTPVMSTRAIHEGVPMAEVPIPYSERVGRSKLSVVRDGSLFLRSIIWTVLTYNPVRILGLIGLLGMGLGLLAALGLVAARVRGVTSLAYLEVAALFAGGVAGITGLSIFSLGITFNYLVSLFHRRPVRQGLFGKPLFRTPLENHFSWLGLLTLGLGLLLGLASLALSLRGWEITRLWLYLLASAMLILVGVQLIISWVLQRVLQELRDNHS
ncbi:MAG: glycosyltransferase family 2 protein [Anaerolineales bacterium]|nr:glycosyltransferase family 2 protein [Anaerolineales bacterium]MCB8950876.1 glycosyltransferase family 2 protein [Ardenticatenales bacterium]